MFCKFCTHWLTMEVAYWVGRPQSYRSTVLTTANFPTSLYFSEHVCARFFLICHRGGRRQRRAICPLCHTQGPLFRHQGQGESTTAAGPGTGACPWRCHPSEPPAGTKSIFHMGAIDKAAVLHYSQLSGVPTFPPLLSAIFFIGCACLFLYFHISFFQKEGKLAEIEISRVLKFYFFFQMETVFEYLLLTWQDVEYILMFQFALDC